MIKNKPVAFLAFLIFCFCCFSEPIYATGPTKIMGTDINEPTTWTKENSPYILGGTVDAKKTLTIEAGTVVKFNRGSVDNLKIESDFYVNGTQDEPVVFTSIRDDSFGGDTNGDGSSTKPKEGDWVYILFNPSQDHEMRINHAIVTYANQGFFLLPSTRQTKDIIIMNSEIRNNNTGITIGSNAEPQIEKNLISDNSSGISIYPNSKKSKAIDNSIIDNDVGAIAGKSDDISLEAEYNWWGDESGPYDEENNSNGQGNSVSGAVSFEPWLNEDPIENPDPVLIIPGIMGSWKNDKGWQIDPIFHTYDNLYQAFEISGYISNETLFTFPYEWRDSNEVNAVELRAKIQAIKDFSHKPKVDIVAHSMGGLLARAYIESDFYENDVDQLITIGTPQLGAPKDYIKWEAGASSFDIFDMAAKRIFELEALENGYLDVFHYIRNRPIASVQELLPVYNYLYDVEGENNILRKTYPEKYPRNQFLEDLNDGNEDYHPENLNKVDFIKIIGKLGNNKSVLSGYNVEKIASGELWQDGYPKNFNNPLLIENGLQKSDGDGTVPLYSSEAREIPDDGRVYLAAEHNALPTKAQGDILKILTGKNLIDETAQWHIPNLLIFLVHSPIDIQVQDEDGNIVGRNFGTGDTIENIPDSFYSADNSGKPCADDPEETCDARGEFITIPNPKGEYKIISKGTAEGDYRIDVAKISENNDGSGSATESVAAIEETTKTGDFHKAAVEVSEEKVEIIKDTEAPVIKINEPQEEDYLNNEIITVDYEISDDFSQPENIAKEIELDGEEFTDSNVDLSLLNLGEHTFKITAADEAENSAEKEIKFVTNTNINAIRDNVDHYFNLKLINTKYEKLYLKRKTAQIEELFRWLDQVENAGARPAVKKILTDGITSTIRFEVKQTINHINSTTARLIDKQASDLLQESLKSLI